MVTGGGAHERTFEPAPLGITPSSAPATTVDADAAKIFQAIFTAVQEQQEREAAATATTEQDQRMGMPGDSATPEPPTT